MKKSFISFLLVGFVVSLFLTVDSYALKEDIKIKDVDVLSLDEIGVLYDSNGGLGADIWKGSDRGFVETLLVDMPTDIKSEVGKDLRTRLLLTSAVPPKTQDDSLSLIEVRLKLLALNGQADEVTKLLKQIPVNRVTGMMNQIHVSSMFVVDNYVGACGQVNKFFETDKDLFWRKTKIICDGFLSKKNEVDLSLGLLKEDGHEISPEFKLVAKGMLKKEKDKAKAKWSELIKAQVLGLPKVDNVFPSLSKINTAPLPKDMLVKWFDDNKKLSNDKKLKEAFNLYQVVDALGVDVELAEWQEFVALAVVNDIDVSEYVMLKVLDLLVEKDRKGLAVLVILQVLDGKGAKDLSHEAFVKVVESLRKMGFVDEAKSFAVEGLG